MQPNNKLILALDVDSIEKAEALVSELKDHVGIYKVGKELFTATGPEIVKKINQIGGKVFLDMKYHDIPNTVAKAAEAATKLGVYMFNIHASGGYKMMYDAVEAVKKSSAELGIKKPLVLGVTVLTSIDQTTLNNELRINGTVEEQVVHLAKLAQKAGLDGVIASPQEIKAIRAACGSDFLIVTPGVRPLWAASQDQKRVTTPKEAIEQGADYLVIGRPITGAENRIDAAKKILEEIKNA